MHQWQKAKEIVEKINSQIAYDTRAKEVSKILNSAIGGTQPLTIERWAVNKVKTMWEELLEKEEKDYIEQFCKQEGIAP